MATVINVSLLVDELTNMICNNYGMLMKISVPLKSLILFGIRGMAAYAYHAYVLNFEDPEVNQFFCEALFKIGYAESMDELLPTVLKVGEINLKCMALLDKANTQTYGTPEPTDVTLTVEKGTFYRSNRTRFKGPAALLEQTNGKGINIYTHGEMLPLPMHIHS